MVAVAAVATVAAVAAVEAEPKPPHTPQDPPQDPPVEVRRVYLESRHADPLDTDPVIWSVPLPGNRSLRVLIDPGTTGLKDSDGIVSTIDFPESSAWPRTPGARSHLLRFPNGSLVSTLPTCAAPTTPALRLTPASISIGDGCHALLSKGGLARLSRELGLQVDWSSNSVSLPSTTVRRVNPEDPESPMPPEIRARAAAEKQQLLEEFKDVLRSELDGLPEPRPTDVRLPPPDQSAVHTLSSRAMFRRIPLTAPEIEFLDKYFAPLERMGLIEPADSSFNSPVFLVPKKPLDPDLMKRFRPVFDQRIVNSLFPKLSTAYPPIGE